MLQQGATVYKLLLAFGNHPLILALYLVQLINVSCCILMSVINKFIHFRTVEHFTHLTNDAGLLSIDANTN